MVVRLPGTLKADLELMASREGVTVSDLVRDAVTALIEMQTDPREAPVE